MRRRWIFRDGEMVEITADYQQPTGVLLMTDLPGYVSPTTGLWVEGRKQRREDLKRSGCRPWEGRDQELKEAARHDQYAEQRLDASIDRAAREAFHQLPPSKRDLLKRI